MNTPTRKSRRPRRATAALGAVHVLLAVPIGVGGIQKVLGDPTMVDMFHDIGAGQWLRVVVGTLEILGAVGVLTPRIWGLAALGLSGVLLGATVTNLLILHASPLPPLVFLALAATIAYARRSQLAQLRSRATPAGHQQAAADAR